MYIFFILLQLYACLMLFFISNAIEGQMISTGAFEISYNGEFCFFSLKKIVAVAEISLRNR